MKIKWRYAEAKQSRIINTPTRPVYSPYKLLNINDLKLLINTSYQSLSLHCTVAGNATGR